MVADKEYATADFTEGWVRASGLYDFKPEDQLKLMKSFIDDNCNPEEQHYQKCSLVSSISPIDILPNLLSIAFSDIFT